MNPTCIEAYGAYVVRVRANEQLSEYVRDQRESLWFDLIASLGVFGVKVLGHLRGALVIDARPNMGAGDLWTVCDNGGELNVERINAPETLRSVPYTAHRRMLDGATMAYRVRCALDGKPVDYDRSFAGEAGEFRENQGVNA